MDRFEKIAVCFNEAKENRLVIIGEIKIRDYESKREVAKILSNNGFEIAYDNEHSNCIYLLKRKGESYD